MTKNQKFKIFIMTLLLIGSTYGTNFILCRQVTSESDVARVKNFYKLEKNGQDMIMIGASTVFTDYSAALAWKEFGYTSYSLATNMAPMGLAKSMLIEARKTQNPKLFVIDINGILYNDEQESREGALRLWIDNMPSSRNRIDTINELVPKDQRLAYYFPFLKYHSNWSQLDKCFKQSIEELSEDTDNIHLSVLGMQGNSKIEPQRNYIDIKKYNNTSSMHKLSGQHLKDLLDYCKEEKLTNIIFTNMPRYYSKKMLPERERNNSAKELIKKYGYDCIDMDDDVEKIGLDPENDFYNQNHLNIYGQKKLTVYLGKLLNERYKLSDGGHKEEISKRYDQEVKAYEKVYNWVDMYAKKGQVKYYNYRVIKDILEE